MVRETTRWLSPVATAKYQTVAETIGAQRARRPSSAPRPRHRLDRERTRSRPTTSKAWAQNLKDEVYYQVVFRCTSDASS